MSLAIKRRQQAVSIPQVAFIFFASFSLSFVVGSLSFIPYESMADSYFGIDLEPAIALAVSPADFSLPDSETFSIDEFVESTDNIDIVVSTNNVIGYTLTMSTSNSTTGLVHTNGLSTIQSTSNQSPGELDINTWGYSLGTNATSFRRIPSLGTQAILVNANLPVEAAATTVTIGAKADTTFPSGNYQSTLKFTAVAR